MSIYIYLYKCMYCFCHFSQTAAAGA